MTWLVSWWGRQKSAIWRSRWKAKITTIQMVTWVSLMVPAVPLTIIAIRPTRVLSAIQSSRGSISSPALVEIEQMAGRRINTTTVYCTVVGDLWGHCVVCGSNWRPTVVHQFQSAESTYRQLVSRSSFARVFLSCPGGISLLIVILFSPRGSSWCRRTNIGKAK